MKLSKLHLTDPKELEYIDSIIKYNKTTDAQTKSELYTYITDKLNFDYCSYM